MKEIVTDGEGLRFIQDLADDLKESMKEKKGGDKKVEEIEKSVNTIFLDFEDDIRPENGGIDYLMEYGSEMKFAFEVS